jgi:hypothetical protein
MTDGGFRGENGSRRFLYLLDFKGVERFRDGGLQSFSILLELGPSHYKISWNMFFIAGKFAFSDF